jgi:photosystem II stability/assembly factor-like uncharacterized protein
VDWKRTSRFALVVLTTVLPLSAFAAESLAVAGSERGLYISKDGGLTWGRNPALGDLAIRAVALDRSDFNRLYLSALGSIYSSADGGETWNRFEVPNLNPVFLRAGRNGIVATSDSRTLWRSTDGGTTWVAETGLPNSLLDYAIGAGVPPVEYALTTSGLYTRSAEGFWTQLPGLERAAYAVGRPQGPRRADRHGKAGGPDAPRRPLKGDLSWRQKIWSLES